MPNTGQSKNQITVRLWKTNDEENIAYGFVMLRGLRLKINVYRSETGIRILWPSIKDKAGKWKEIAGPLDLETRKAWATFIAKELRKVIGDEKPNPVRAPAGANIDDSDDNW